MTNKSGQVSIVYGDRGEMKHNVSSTSTSIYAILSAQLVIQNRTMYTLSGFPDGQYVSLRDNIFKLV